MNPFDISGRRAVVTGAAGGLGRGIAEGLLEANASVAMIDVSPRLENTVIELSAIYPGGVWGVHGDLCGTAAREDAFQQAVSKLGGGPDILINCAGVQRRAPCEEYTLEDWDLVMEVNLRAVFHLCRLAGKRMLAAGGGKIVNIASMLSFFGGRQVPAYATSKGGVAQLTKALANAWAGRGVNVNAIAPGYMATEMNDALLRDAARSESILSRIPAGRWGRPEDLKGLAVFLCSPAADYIHGAIIPADGGYLGC